MQHLVVEFNDAQQLHLLFNIYEIQENSRWKCPFTYQNKQFSSGYYDIKIVPYHPALVCACVYPAVPVAVYWHAIQENGL